MKKKLMLRCLMGAPVGLAISYLITVLISVFMADGRYHPVVPELIAQCGSEINAVLLQTACSLLYGLSWGGVSVIWEMEEWSLLRMTLTHLVVCSVTMFPIAYFMWWMPHNMTGILLYFGIFFGIYLCIWFSQYYAMKKRIEQLNRKVREENGG